MEPGTAARRVRLVHSAASWDPGLRAAGGDPPPLEAVADTELDVVEPSFELFYGTARDTVGRALALTLRDPELAADAVDEAMVRAYQHWPKVSGLDNPAGWAYRVGLNYARSRVRRRRGREHLLHGPQHQDPPTVEPAIAGAVGRLPARQRAVVVCRFLLGWSEAETATALGIRPGTVKSRLHRALGALQLELEHLRQEDR
jgi:RNA polymerase sigma factor (sigma-70 family)